MPTLLRTGAVSLGMRPVCSSHPTKPHSMKRLNEAPVVAARTPSCTQESHKVPACQNDKIGALHICEGQLSRAYMNIEVQEVLRVRQSN